MASCQKCGTTDWEVLSRKGVLEVLKCKRCGTEETVHTYYVNEKETTKADEAWFALTIALPSSLSAHQVQVLRQTFRKFELMSPAAIKKAAIVGELLDMGQYPLSEVKMLVRQVESIGMALRQTQVTAPQQARGKQQRK